MRKKLDESIESLWAQRSNTEKSVDGLIAQAYSSDLSTEKERDYFCHIYSSKGYIEGIEYSLNLIRDHFRNNSDYNAFNSNQYSDLLNDENFKDDIEEALKEYSLLDISDEKSDSVILKKILSKLIRRSYNLKKNNELLFNLNFENKSRVDTEKMVGLITDYIRNQGFVQGIFWTLEILTDDIEEVENYFDLKSYILDFKKYLVFLKDQHKENVKYLKNIEEHYDFEILDQVI